MYKNLQIFLIFTLIFVNPGCKNKKSPFEIKLKKEEKVEIKIHRYEKVLMNINVNNIRNELKKYKNEYMLFLDGNLDDTLKILQLYNFVSDPTLHEIYDNLIKKYPDLSYLEENLSNSFSYFKHYFPEKQIPKLYSYISFLDYNNRVIYLDTVMAIALDMYLGPNFPMYPSVKIPKYISNRLDSNYIVVDCFKAIAEKFISFNPENKSLLDNMIYSGKILYFCDLMLPDISNEIKIAYTKEQYQWCEKNEKEIWSFFMKNNLLYNSNYFKIRPFISEAPTTRGFKDSPPRFAEWIGWQIVKSYMENNKTNIKDFLSDNDSQKILTLSKYKPRK